MLSVSWRSYTLQDVEWNSINYCNCLNTNGQLLNTAAIASISFDITQSLLHILKCFFSKEISFDWSPSLPKSSYDLWVFELDLLNSFSVTSQIFYSGFQIFLHLVASLAGRSRSKDLTNAFGWIIQLFFHAQHEISTLSSQKTLPQTQIKD